MTSDGRMRHGDAGGCHKSNLAIYLYSIGISGGWRTGHRHGWRADEGVVRFLKNEQPWLQQGVQPDDLDRIRTHLQQERALGNPKFQAMVEKALGRRPKRDQGGGRDVRSRGPGTD